MPRSNPDGPLLSPAKQYRQRRLTQYRHILEIALGHLEPHLLFMSSTSIFQGSQTSWLGVIWRSCIVAGVGNYSTWYWFTGVDSLSTDGYSTYISYSARQVLQGLHVYSLKYSPSSIWFMVVRWHWHVILCLHSLARSIGRLSSAIW